MNHKQKTREKNRREKEKKKKLLVQNIENMPTAIAEKLTSLRTTREKKKK